MTKGQIITLTFVTILFGVANFQDGIGQEIFGAIIGFAITYGIIYWVNKRKALTPEQKEKIQKEKTEKLKQKQKFKQEKAQTKLELQKAKFKAKEIERQRKTAESKEAVMQCRTVRKSTRVNKNIISNPTQHLKEIKDYLKTTPSFNLDDKKRINSRTGYPLAKQSSIDRSKEGLTEMLSWPSNNYYEEAAYGQSQAIDDYLLGIELPYLHAGTIAYKQGDWDLAEKWWLSVLDIRPTNVTRKLEIMYRKQHRYKDIVVMYKKADLLVKKYDRLVHDHTYSSFKNLAVLEEENHKKPDQSVGVKDYPSKIDMDYVRLLQSVSKQ